MLFRSAVRDGAVEHIDLGEAGGPVAVERLFVADDTAVWIGTNDGLVRYHRGAAQRFDRQVLLGQSDSLAQRTPQTRSTLVDSSFVRAFVQDRRGAIWMATSDGLLQYSDGKFRALSTADGLPSNELQTVVEGERGVLWIGTADGLSAYDGQEIGRAHV